MYTYASLTLTTITFLQPCLDVSQLELSVDPVDLVAGEKTELRLSAVLSGESPKPTNFGVPPRTELLVKFIILRGLTLAASLGNFFKQITSLKYDIEWPFKAKDTSMLVSNGSAFLPLFVIQGWLGLITSCLTMRSGETELRLDPRLEEINLEFSSELTSRCVES